MFTTDVQPDNTGSGDGVMVALMVPLAIWPTIPVAQGPKMTKSDTSYTKYDL